MTAGAPSHELFWFASRALGVVAFAMLGVTVSVGLSIAGRLTHRPGIAPKLRRFHETAALVTLGLIAGHAGLLLGDRYLHPGLTGITIPFAMHYRPQFTGLGIIAGWLAAILGLSFYVRRRIGPKLWRFLHRFTVAVYLLAIVHVLGAGTDAHSPWMLATVTGLTMPVVFAFTHRMLSGFERRTPSRA
ncbi:MAG TPA: hypothetical protein VFW09_16285 [Solirubrobacteraceae bacterium]|nr:hypothetical protein [Solirubrobacteraceae bacterium]